MISPTGKNTEGALWPWLRMGWSWLSVVVEVTIAVIWLITIASALSGDWPEARRWVMLLGVTAMAVSRRIQTTYPKLSQSLFFAATIVMIVALFGLGR